MRATATIQEQLSSPKVITRVRNWLRKNKSKARYALARYLCDELELRDRMGKSRVAGVQKALRVLEARGLWKLPKHHRAGPGQWSPRRLNDAVQQPRDMPPRVEQVEGLRLVEVDTNDDVLFRTWNELILTEHPLRDCRLVGRQLRYLISSDHGWLGAIGFGSCALRLRAREEWKGRKRALVIQDTTDLDFSDRLHSLHCCDYGRQMPLYFRPTGCWQHHYGEFSSSKILPITKVLVRGDEDIKRSICGYE